MELGSIALLVGSLGGIELLKWWRTRRAEKRQKETEAATGELHYYKEVADFYKQENDTLRNRVTNLENDVADTKNRLRNTQDNLLDSERKLNRTNEKLIAREKKIGDLELTVQYLIDWRCHKAECDDREPPNKKLCGLKFDPSRVKDKIYKILNNHESK